MFNKCTHLNKETGLYEFKCISDREFNLIARHTENHNTRVVITYITPEEEKELKTLKEIEIIRDNVKFLVQPNMCYHIGYYDFTPNNKNLKETQHLFDMFELKHFIPSNWDYETNTYVSENKEGKWFDTTDPVTYLPYLYASIGKPERVVIFKEILDLDKLLEMKNKFAESKKKREYKHSMEYIKRKKLEKLKSKKLISIKLKI